MYRLLLALDAITDATQFIHIDVCSYVGNLRLDVCRAAYGAPPIEMEVAFLDRKLKIVIATKAILKL